LQRVKAWAFARDLGNLPLGDQSGVGPEIATDVPFILVRAVFQRGTGKKVCESLDESEKAGTGARKSLKLETQLAWIMGEGRFYRRHFLQKLGGKEW